MAGIAMFKGSGFVDEAFHGLDGASHRGAVLHIARARQVFFLGFVLLIVIAALGSALSPWAARIWLGLGPWILGGLGVGGVIYLLVGGQWWFEQPIVALFDRGILIRAFGGATMVPWLAVRAVSVDASGGRPRLRLALAPGASVERRGRHRIETVYASRGSVRVPVTMFEATPREIEARIRTYLREASPSVDVPPDASRRA